LRASLSLAPIPHASTSCRASRINDTQEMACEHHLFARLGGIVEVHRPVRMRVFVGTVAATGSVLSRFTR
jgi:hypothetical protein